MGMNASRMPAHLQANRENMTESLKALGIEDAAAMQGGEVQVLGQVDDSEIVPEFEAGTVAKTVDVFGKLNTDDSGTETPGEVPGTPQPEAGEGNEPLTGLAKREADARAAQSEMSKTQTKLLAMEKRLEGMFHQIGDRIEQLQALQVSVGDVPSNLKPASEEVMAKWEDQYDEALSVIDARVAPLYRAIKGLELAFNSYVDTQKKHLAETRATEVRAAVFSILPEVTAKRVVGSQEFLAWYKQQDPAFRETIRQVVEETDSVHPDTFRKVFRDFSRDTGIDIGLDRPAPQGVQESAPTDTYPSVRSAASPSRTKTPGRAPDETTPLTVDEMLNYQTLMVNADPRQRAILAKRAAITQLSLDGSVGQSLK